MDYGYIFTRFPTPFRRYARVWLDEDYERAAAKSAKRRKKTASVPEPAGASPKDQIAATVAQRYREATGRADIDAGEGASIDAGTPVAGVLLHEQIVMNALMQYVTRLLGSAEKLRFFMDQDSGLRQRLWRQSPKRS